MIDVFAESVGIQMNLVNFKAIMGQGFVADLPVILAKPQTYMNLSGESSGPLAAYYKLPLNRVLVVILLLFLAQGLTILTIVFCQKTYNSIVTLGFGDVGS
jgi:peptidyl-tRNA hydrolase